MKFSYSGPSSQVLLDGRGMSLWVVRENGITEQIKERRDNLRHPCRDTPLSRHSGLSHGQKGYDLGVTDPMVFYHKSCILYELFINA